MYLCDGNLELYSGEDGQVLPLLSIGGIGVISVLSNIAPRQTHDMVMEYLEGDQEKARQIQLSATPLIDALFSEVNPIPVKAAMNMMGMQQGRSADLSVRWRTRTEKYSVRRWCVSGC